MKQERSNVVKEDLDAQRQHWENTLSTRPEMFGVEASDPARYAAEVFKTEGRNKLLELGAGQGRDTLFFAQNGFEIYALDYSQSGLKDIMRKARASGLANSVNAICHDVRHSIPFDDF
jgi:cyclopropane fatty-acyl-phospholipid synthase-like methyltransferase